VSPRRSGYSPSLLAPSGARRRAPRVAACEVARWLALAFQPRHGTADGSIQHEQDRVERHVAEEDRGRQALGRDGVTAGAAEGDVDRGVAHDEAIGAREVTADDDEV